MTSLCCNICGYSVTTKLYESELGRSINSLGQVYEGTTSVWHCERCGHLQSSEMACIDNYYDNEYQILANSEDEDQIYVIKDGRPIYRTQHQLEVFLKKVDLPPRAKILDYGCAKSSTIKALLQVRPDLIPHLFDVSDSYVDFWSSFVSPDNCKTYEINDDWSHCFDAVTSFFSLEHIGRPLETLRKIHSLLKPGGIFYCVVPNVIGNIADFIVADHVNHFTDSSLNFLLSSANFRTLMIDENAHRGAFVITAVAEDADLQVLTEPGAIERQAERLHEIGAFWSDAKSQIQEFERLNSSKGPTVIYGAGFYGSFIFLSLQHPEAIELFLDQNPFIQGNELFGLPIAAPSSFIANAKVIYAGLNPSHARDTMAPLLTNADNDKNVFFFEGLSHV